MKNTVLKCTRILLMMFVALSFAFTFVLKTQSHSVDLVKLIKKLDSENRRDDALVLIKAFKGKTERDNNELAKIEKQLEYDTIEKFKSALWNGTTKGEVYDHYSGLGALIADMCLWGYIRDLAIEGYDFITRDSSNENAMMLLSGTGVSSFCYPIIDGASVLAKNMEKYLKSSFNTPSGGLLRQYVSGDLSPTESQKIWLLFKKTTGPYPERQPSFPTFPTCNTSIRHPISSVASGRAVVHHRLRYKYIDTFRKHPKSFVGIAGSPLMSRIIKILDRYSLISIFLPIIFLAIVMTMLPDFHSVF